MVFLIVGLSFLTGFCFLWGSFYILAAEKLQIQGRLKELRNSKSKEKSLEDELQKPFMERIVKPLLGSFSVLTKKFTPAKKRLILDKKLVLAGNPGGLTTNEFLSLQYSVAIILAVAGYVLGYMGHWGTVMQIIFAAWGFLLGYFLLDLYIKIKIKNRQTEITKDLPDVLDLLTVSVEAGLGFDAALQRVVQKAKGAVAVEFAKTLKEIKMGKPRKDALKDLGLRTGVEDLNTVISAIVQADQLGVSVGNVLRVQSDQIRRKRRQSIEEKAMKAPIKMLLPMVFFIFPTIFIVLLGPALIQMMENLGK